MSNTQFMGPLMVPNDEPKSVNIDKISTALHVYNLNLIVNYLSTVQIAQIQAYNFECTPCSDAISGPMNRVFDIKSGHDFCRYRNSIQVIYFQSMVLNNSLKIQDRRSCACSKTIPNKLLKQNSINNIYAKSQKLPKETDPILVCSIAHFVQY